MGFCRTAAAGADNQTRSSIAPIAEMPASYARIDGPRLRADIIARREQLPRAAEEFYRVLAREVDFNATDDPDLADVTRSSDGSVTVALFARDSLGSGARSTGNAVSAAALRPDATRAKCASFCTVVPTES